MSDINQVYEKIKASLKNERVRKSLDAIHKTCEEQLDRGSHDFSIATIARLGESIGVPKAQSIRNKTGEPYRALITAWQNANSTQKNKNRVSNEDDWIEKITDASARFLVRDLIASNRKLKSELRICKSVKTLEIDMRSNTVNAFPNNTPLPQLMNSEWDALTSAITPEFLESRNWKADSRGRVHDKNSKTIFKNGFITAIEKIITIKN